MPIHPPILMDHLDEALPELLGKRLGLIVDFDGTVAEIAPTPDEARVSPDCAEALAGLAEAVDLVAVVSGRSVADLKSKVGVAGLVYVGNHGAEYQDGEQRYLAPGADKYRGQVVAAFEHLRSIVTTPGLIWQDKGLSASVHYRLAPDPEDARRSLIAALDSVSGVEGLEVFWGRRVLELRSSLGMDKGYAVRKLTRDRGLDGVIVLGDDVTDVDAMRALDELGAGGELRGLSVAVVHDDSPRALLDAADYRLNGVGEVQEFLVWLLTALVH